MYVNILQESIQKQGIQSHKKKDVSKNFNSSYAATLTKTDSVSFKGQAEIKAAKKIVEAHSLTAVGLTTLAGLPYDNIEAAFSANYLAMAKRIADVYKLKIKQKVMTSTIDGLAVRLNKIVTLQKLFAWIPGVGGQINAAIPYGTTYSIGHALFACS